MTRALLLFCRYALMIAVAVYCVVHLARSIAHADAMHLKSWLDRYTVQPPQTDEDIVDSARRRLYAQCGGKLRKDLQFDVRVVDNPNDGLVSGSTLPVRVAVPRGNPCIPRQQSDFEAGRFAK